MIPVLDTILKIASGRNGVLKRGRFHLKKWSPPSRGPLKNEHSDRPRRVKKAKISSGDHRRAEEYSLIRLKSKRPDKPDGK